MDDRKTSGDLQEQFGTEFSLGTSSGREERGKSSSDGDVGVTCVVNRTELYGREKGLGRAFLHKGLRGFSGLSGYLMFSFFLFSLARVG